MHFLSTVELMSYSYLITLYFYLFYLYNYFRWYVSFPFLRFCVLTILTIHFSVLDAFAKEISVMSKLHHPNIVLMIGTCILPDNLMIVMELMEGGSVWLRLRNRNVQCVFYPWVKRSSHATYRGSLPTAFGWIGAVDTCRGMSYLHRDDNKILHLDLKSANILLDSSLRGKVADFGLAVVKKLKVCFIAHSNRVILLATLMYSFSFPGGACKC